MNIKVNSAGYGISIIYEAENVKIEEQISETIYALKEDGKKDYKQRTGEDITDSSMKMFINLLDDIIYQRKRDFDSSELIERLFEKLPQDKAEELVKKLLNDYDI